MKNILIIMGLLSLFSCLNTQSHYITIDGFTQGTTYHMIYRDEKMRNLKPEVDSLLAVFDNSLSVYNPQSIISKVNRNEDVEVDDYFIKVFEAAKEMYDIGGGAFNIAASPLFNVWGFGSKTKEMPTPAMIDSLKEFIDMDMVRLEERRVVKDDPRITLNANAIAKGYSSDVVAAFFDSKEITDYMVEIGGEIRCKGKNSRGGHWNVGIDKPIDGNYVAGSDLSTILKITDCALATSGNYRKFYIQDGKKYHHTIDPKTGYPVAHNLLSATVIADECIYADAYATIFMVIGVEATKEFLVNHTELKVYLIYDDHGAMKTWYTQNLISNMK